MTLHFLYRPWYQPSSRTTHPASLSCLIWKSRTDTRQIWKMECNNLLLSHILLQYVHFCMFNYSQKSALVICPQGKYPYLPSYILYIRICPQISVFALTRIIQSLYYALLIQRYCRQRAQYYSSYIFTHISVFVPVFNFRYLRSGLKDQMSKYKNDDA